MKRLAALLLIGVMVCGLAACGSAQNDQKPADSAVQADSSQAGETDSGSAADEADSDSMTPADGAAEDGENPADSASGGSESDYGFTIPAFDSEDLYGNAVSSEIFAGKDVTMVNCWGTFCPPCIAEMPDLQKLSEQLPENAQMIGIVIDVAQFNTSALDAGVEIVEDAGVTYPNVILDEALAGELTPQIQYVPTTFFVDGEGKLLCDPVIGASMDAYVTQLQTLLDGWTYQG